MIRQGASETRDKAGQLKDTAESLTASVADTANRMRTLEAEAAEDQGLAKEVIWNLKYVTFQQSKCFVLSIGNQALEKANQAKSISADSTVKVREAISSVNEILISLNNMGNIGIYQDITSAH